MLRKEIVINIYNYKIVLIYCDYEAICKFFKNKIGSEINNSSGLTVTFPQQYKSYIWINTEALCWQTSLVHEAIHVALDICKIYKIKNVVSNQEPFAYLTDYIFEKFFKYLNNKI